ncbi:hypothetical protein JYU34_012775 [Plutella xylostella]|uniref:Calponin-homology (CH) domain-containing protein n=1 Tax=Plutella xylostella TaxID=51655 RepID=A0ABQ7QFQ3_PLUXY|nr:hypothetical protein JYU34_012775 [Plutella xylostella]
MYFQIENTPEHIRRSRRAAVVREQAPQEELPRLVIAPFSRPPQVVFENVVIGTTCERSLEVLNPSKQEQQITLGKALPEGLIIHLPGEYMTLEPETCYCLTMMWTPMQPTALRETIRFTNESRGRYDVIVVLKSAMNIKGKGIQPKGFKISPGKMKKKSNKKSPVAIYKKKSEVIYNTTKIKKTVNVTQTTVQHRMYSSSNKENMSNNMTHEYLQDPKPIRCPFDSPTNIEFNFDTSEVFANMKRSNQTEVLQQTYETSFRSNTMDLPVVPSNVLKPSNKQNFDNTVSDVFDNITFTPLKAVPTKSDKLVKGPQIILSVNSESDFDDSLDMKYGNKENATHSILCITSNKKTNQWVNANQQKPYIDSHFVETPTVINKKIPNTSSPKEFNSPNFSINTDFSRISDLSFFPPRFSTERKVIPKPHNETHEIIDDPKLSSDTFTKDSPFNPYPSLEPQYQYPHVHHGYSETRPPQYSQQPKVCRQSLFKEFQHQRDHMTDRNYVKVPAYETEAWQNQLRVDTKSPPPRSITPPLQSIPEESTQFYDTKVFDKTDAQQCTFTINRTFDKANERPSLSHSTRQSWSKKAVRVEPELWKVPVAQPRKSIKPKTVKKDDSMVSKISNTTFEGRNSIQNLTLNQIGNVYSQSLTIDPFLSSTYFYDEEAVDKFEKEFKRWLNCILTPPADLESNIEQKIDVGKAWIENRNKEVPLAPTKEQVCSSYHNSHRLESLRRSARGLLMSPEIAQVFLKLNAQIEKKLIAIRTDRNLHLDVGLQKIIMELLLSYNPLWLRIGLEAIYGIVLPLKSNSDIEGLTSFIIQRMFKNPHLKNKHSKSNAPNMLLPAYMEAIKKFTLKKFFMLVFFLDQAKQRKLIPHDPCLFCRNAICKESREIVIRFTREVIAGIGDITRHLRPLGYVVSHKQSYLDEYKYAVHNIAVDIRDGVRLTKVMEIILMKSGLMNQLRTPAISRLQKIHNVHVALNALKEADFAIVGDITPNDIADGHREKTLSLLWQLIHVFRAPLFEKASVVIQTWWRKKYEVIVAKRIEEEKVRQKKNNAASVIQCWWRRIQYARLVEWKMQQVTHATIVVQKFCRMWLCKTRLRKIKTSVLTIEQWYRNVKLMREAKETLKTLRLEREERRHRAAIKIQTYVRRWSCIRKYEMTVKKIVLVQSLIRCFLIRKWYLNLRNTVLHVQERYRGKLLMKEEMRRFEEQRKSAICIQSFYRMYTQQKMFMKLKKAVTTLEERYIALNKMRNERQNYLDLKRSAITVQSRYRSKKARTEYLKQRMSIIQLQRRVRANQLMTREREDFLRKKRAAVILQTRFRAHSEMKKQRKSYTDQRNTAIVIQKHFRGHLLTKAQRNKFLQLKSAATVLQQHYRNLKAMRNEREKYLKLKESAVIIQRQYRALIMMRECREQYQKIQIACTAIQRRYRAQLLMRKERHQYQKVRSACSTIQNAFRAHTLRVQQRQKYLQMKEAAICIQKWVRRCRITKQIKEEYQHSKQACVAIQRTYRAYIAGKKQRQEYLRIKTATVCIQKYYRLYVEMKIVREQYVQLKTATVTIQRHFRSHIAAKKQRTEYLETRTAICKIQSFYRQCRETKKVRQEYLKLRCATVCIQRYYRSVCVRRKERNQYLRLKQASLTIQQRYRALIAMRNARQSYNKLKHAAKVLQTRFRAQVAMKQERSKYICIVKACMTIQQRYKAYLLGKKEQNQYLKLRQAAVTVQQRFRANLTMRKHRDAYVKIQTATITIQRRYRAQKAMVTERTKYMRVLKATACIQARCRAYLTGKNQRQEYVEMKQAALTIQRKYRLIREYRIVRNRYLQIRKSVVLIQRQFRANRLAREVRRNNAAQKIQVWYKSVQMRNECRTNFLKLKQSAVVIQSAFRMLVLRRQYLQLKNATLTLQRYYKAYVAGQTQRKEYVQTRSSIIKLQAHVRRYIVRKSYLKQRSAAIAIQRAYRLKKERELIKKRREEAAVCLQKNIRCYLVQSKYMYYRKQVMLIQNVWRSKLVTRLYRCEFLQKRRYIIKLQAVIRGYLVRKDVQHKLEQLEIIKEERRIHRAASKIQALFRGHHTRTQLADRRVAELRLRWRRGALRSDQESMRERNEEAMEVLSNLYDIETVIRAFRSLELLTEVFPMMYNADAGSISRRVFIYMSVTNRSISSIEVLKSAAAVLVNLARYRVTGPKIYARDRIAPVLKFMWRFSNSETQLFCILCTYLWLFAKYDVEREDLTEYLQVPENHKMLVTIKCNVDRMKRMAENSSKTRFSTPQSHKFISHTMNQSMRDASSNILMPALEPDFGIKRADKPRYFEDASQAINCLFRTFKL